MTKLLAMAKALNIKVVTILLISTLSIGACKQMLSSDIVRYADRSTYMVSDQALRSVDRAFYSSFSVGNWYYQGAKAKFGEVNAYIQIPQKLDMPDDVQQRYLKQIVCPKADQTDLWYQLKDIDLSVHVYTFTKQKSVSATCINPFKQRT